MASGMEELDQWLRDQVAQGLAAAAKAGYRHWDAIAARMVDAQCPAVAERLRSLGSAPHSGTGWEGRMLEELAMLRLLATAYLERDSLPPDLLASVRARIGFTVRQAHVIATAEPVPGTWDVLGRRDAEQDRIRTRRTWLRGRGTGRPALVLSFAAAGETLDESLAPGTAVNGPLAFYPAAVPLRAVFTQPPAARAARTPEGGTITGMLRRWADALGADPWLENWPAVLANVTPARSPVPSLADASGDALPLHPGAGDCWPMFAASGGSPLTVAVEWTARGLWPLTAWAGAEPPAIAGLAAPVIPLPASLRWSRKVAT